MATANLATTAPKPVRCAIYTRKSTEEGLNQEFNSLDAQRESAEAYILSQRHAGWTLIPDQYSDGGYTLNTNSSLGRLTLNILLSFAQFEREIISERTRDKQVAARKKGKWTGGHILLGYDLDPRGGGKLAVNPDEAARIREMFRLYLEGTPVIEIVQRFDKLGWRNKQWTTQNGKLYGGSPLRRCHIYKLLGNVLYPGQVKVGDEIFPGEHEAIIDQKDFDLAQTRLKENNWKAGNSAA